MRPGVFSAVAAAAVAVISLGSVQPSEAGTPEWPECSVRGLRAGEIGTRTVDDQKYYVRRMATIFNEALDDFGTSDAHDELEIFCVARSSDVKLGKVAVCLSFEPCPWR